MTMHCLNFQNRLMRKISWVLIQTHILSKKRTLFLFMDTLYLNTKKNRENQWEQNSMDWPDRST